MIIYVYFYRKSNLKELQLRFKKLETEYKALSKNLSEMQIKMSNIEISSHIFNVIRVGRLYESNTDVKIS
jgi:flagellar basal body rod protein FlgG